MTEAVRPEWNGATVRTWLQRRVVSSRLDQAAAQRGGRGEEDACDKASAEEMVCMLLTANTSMDDRQAFTDELRLLLQRDSYAWRGVYDDDRFERHVRSYIRKLMKMTKNNEGFGKTLRYQ